MLRRESFPGAPARRVAAIVVRSFDGPSLTPWDPGHYLFVTRYFAENVHWLLFPHLDLDSNWTAL